MRTPFVLLKYLAKALANAVPGGPLVVDLVVDVLPEACKDAWDWWSKDRSPEERKADVEAVAQAGLEKIKQEVAEIVLEFAGDKPQDVQEMISLLLTQVPSMVRKSLRRPSEPTGKTMAPDREPKDSQDLLLFLPPKPPRFKSGDHFGDWELVELLGVGGFGEVWKARNPHMPSRPPVALKFCLDSTAAKVLRNEAAVLDRVMREGKHSGIVELLHTYLNSATPCLEYEFIEGGDLGGVIQAWHRSEKTRKPEQTARIVLLLAEIVGFAHKLNPPIVHRDLKPANIFVQHTPGGTTHFKIADFGIGGVADNQILRESGRGTTQGRFLVSAVRGSFTPLYASPQQMKGDEPDPRDDVHALGVIWYQMLTNSLNKGRPGGDRYKRRLTELGMTPGMIDLLASCFEDEQGDRPDNAAVLAEKIKEQLSTGHRGESPKPTPIGPALIHQPTPSFPKPVTEPKPGGREGDISETRVLNGRMIAFQPESGVVPYDLTWASLSETAISFQVEDEGDHCIYKGTSTDGCQYDGNYGYANSPRYRPIDPKCSFHVERIASKSHLLELMKGKGAGYSNLRGQLQYAEQVPKDSLFLFGDWRDKHKYGGPMAIVLVPTHAQ